MLVDGRNGSGQGFLDCGGKGVDGWGFSQNVLSTLVWANFVLISQWCKWLRENIIMADIIMAKPAREGGDNINNSKRGALGRALSWGTMRKRTQVA